MAHYIDKDALVAEIERRMDYNAKEFYPGRLLEDNCFLDFLNTLEVKEVDLNEEIESYFKGFGKFPSVGIDDCIDIAKHFFELGLAQNNIENDVQKQKERLLSEIEEAVDSIDYYTVDGLLSTIKEKIEELKAQEGEEV